MIRTKRIYLAGPMTGLPDHNFPAFHEAANRLAAAGWDVCNPADNFNGRTDLPREQYLRADVAMLVQCEAIALLAGWEDSHGAQLEYLIARELNLVMFDAQTLRPLANAPSAAAIVYTQRRLIEALSPSILDEAKGITEGVRQGDYGHPSDDFGRTAQMWSGVLRLKLRDGAQIDAMDVPLCMIAVKLARQAHRHKRDNLVDIAGYARTASMIAGDE